MSDVVRFLREFVRDPLHTAAIAPSSPALAAAMAAVVPDVGQPTVLELGPGTGAITAAIQHRLGDRGRHVAIERHPQWASLLARRFPDVDVVHGDAADLVRITGGGVDVVVSGLPWAAYRGGLVADLAAVLAPEGVVTQFAYAWARRWAPPARAELAGLRRHFADVVIGPTIWGNLPPAVVYYARSPVRDTGDVPRSARRRPRPRHVPLGSAALTRTESGPDGDWVVRSVPGASSTKDYRCPGCEQLVVAGVGHVVAWPAGEDGSVADRRHWHTACWANRLRRRPGGRRR